MLYITSNASIYVSLVKRCRLWWISI